MYRLFSYLELVTVSITNRINDDLDLLKRIFMCIEMLCLCSKTHCCFDNMSDKLNISSKGLYKQFVEDSGD